MHANLILDLGEVRTLAVEASSHLGQAVSQMQLANVVGIVEELQGSVRWGGACVHGVRACVHGAWQFDGCELFD